ncbi:small-subunit processome [Pluteus cervinus]|uniref:Small-subunit processome n=1 Tax=Pluteus cervinus TaxID=181527 RepID=A0ACD3BHY7_9AGAR|nr:small-subunit processome [Pluteus cervinus]
MTSSLRNSLHRRNHKERSQLAHRSRLGILEKHKDYVKRARDYHSKQDRLTRLKQKAAERNKDEFYFSMTREKTKGGLHMRDRGNVALPTDMVKILKSQDENYVRTMRAAGLKKIDKIKSQLMAIANLLKPGQGIEVDESDQLDEAELQVLTESGIISAKSQSAIRRRRPGHVVFVESEEQGTWDVARQYTPSKYNPNSSQQMIEDQSPSDLGWKLNSPKPSKKRKSSSTSETDTSNEIVDNSSNRQRLLKELSARLIRDKQLRNTEREFEMQKLMMGKGARKKISGVQKVEGDRDDDEEDQDEIDARKGRPRPKRTINDETYKPRVYKWRLERKK